MSFLTDNARVLSLNLDNGFSLVVGQDVLDFEPLNKDNEFSKQNHKQFIDALRLYLYQQIYLRDENKEINKL